MNADFLEALRQIEKEKEIPMESLVETIEQALQSAYKKNSGGSAVIKLLIDQSHDKCKLVQQKTVVEEVQNPHAEISLEEALAIKPDAAYDDVIDFPISPDGFGRIAAQTAKQVVVQRIREAERDRVYDDYYERIGEVVTGTVQQKEPRSVLIDLGKIEAILPNAEQVSVDPYHFGDRLKLLILEVRRTPKGPQVVVSRTHPSLIRRLFELEVPEIADGTVTIKSVAREPGARTKISVSSRDDKVDPVGACVGHRGSRVQSVVNELYGERIDIVRSSDDNAEYIASALSPAKGLTVTVQESSKSAFVVAPDNQLSLAIGREGQNVRLAARLTGWRIDIRTQEQAKEIAAAKLGAGMELSPDELSNEENAEENTAPKTDAVDSEKTDIESTEAEILTEDTSEEKSDQETVE